MSNHSVYDSVKARILAIASPAEEKILIEPLATQLYVSATPVREALIRLAAERIVKEVPKAGFYTKAPSESEIGGLYELQAQLLDWSLKSARGRAGIKDAGAPSFEPDDGNASSATRSAALVDATDELLNEIARRSANGEIIQVVLNLNDRTRFARIADLDAYGDMASLLRQLREGYRKQEIEWVGRGMKLYFEEITSRLPDLLRALRGAAAKHSS